MSGFQGSNRLLARHGWKRVQKFVEAVIAREIVDEVPEWHTRADEDGRTAQDLRVTVNDRQAAWHANPLRRFYAAIGVETYRGLQPMATSGIMAAESRPGVRQ
jgi:hypothetical protein